MPRTKATALLLTLATLSVPAFAQGTNPAVRDSSAALNYVQGQVTLDGQPVTGDLTRSPRPLHTGDTVVTTAGSADVVLAPGTLLRLANDTAAEVVAADGNRMEVRLDNGRANIDVNAMRSKSLLLVDLPEGQTQLLKPGLYTFNTETRTVRVYNGGADAFPGSDTSSNVKPVKVKENHEVMLTGDRLHAAGFDRTLNEDLLPWSGSQEAQAAMADGAVTDQSTTRFTSVGYGYGYGPYAFGAYPYAGFGPGFGYPYGLYGYPYGFYGAPFGFGLGFGFGGGYYGRGYGYGLGRGYGGGVRSGIGYGSGVRAGIAGPAHGLAGGVGFHGGGGRR